MLCGCCRSDTDHFANLVESPKQAAAALRDTMEHAVELHGGSMLLKVSNKGQPSKVRPQAAPTGANVRGARWTLGSVKPHFSRTSASRAVYKSSLFLQKHVCVSADNRYVLWNPSKKSDPSAFGELNMRMEQDSCE